MFGYLTSVIPIRIRKAYWAFLILKRRDPKLLLRLIKKVRLASLVDALSNYIDNGEGRKGLIEIRIRGIPSPIKIRPQTSDYKVFVQVLVDEQYAIRLPDPVEYILDAGANIGLASLFFLERYPFAKVLAIEPDPDNFAMCQTNLASYANRLQLVNAAVCAMNGTVSVNRNSLGAWATQVMPAEDGANNSVACKSVLTFMEEYSFPRLDLLKMDIEGSELGVFRDGDTSFLDQTRSCAVECHGVECTEYFTKAVIAAKFKVSEQGELTIARRD